MHRCEIRICPTGTWIFHFYATESKASEGIMADHHVQAFESPKHMTEWQRGVMEAVVSSDLSGLQELLKDMQEHKLDFQFFCNSGTPLLSAVYRNNYDITEKLLGAGASVDLTGFCGITALMEAAGKGNNKMCHLLLNHGANVNAVNDSRCNVLCYARKCETAVFLLEQGANVFSYPDRGIVEDSAVGVAVRRGDTKLVKFYFEYCKTMHPRIPLEPLFIEALFHYKENCAIIVLQQLYFPYQTAKAMSKLNRQSIFEKAASFAYFKLMRLLVELKPQVLQEKWLVQNHIPLPHKEHPDIIMWLLESRKQVPSLVKLCKPFLLS